MLFVSGTVTATAIAAGTGFALDSGDELRWNMLLGLNSVSNLSTVVGFAIQEAFLARVAVA